ncbi:TonB-dependent receptor plug domain-containing protein [Novosphingobium terrae]|uniref:TonB-dependent receptor plug domain-containing protein n=1 Tax=Novosphingobium terrae TaxID=2726189 RepID=UPI00197D3B8F|nr:TonB-dependent receptor [Novosphingobium terrae]
MKVAFSNALLGSAAPLVLGVCLVSGTAFAQDAAKPNEPKAEEAQTIVVTGSILRRTNTETVSPVTTITADQLDQRGISTVQEGLQTLAANNGPALTNSFTANGAFAAGASAISLRGLTTNSTLVLFDGLRAAYYPLADDGSRNFVDLNTIPDDIIEKVDVLKDGASSAYGADAIAGVVNIKTKRQFKGLSIRAEGGISSRADAGSQRISITAGKGDIEENGYNAYVSGFYYHSAELYNRDRPYPFNTSNYGRLGNVASTGVTGGVNDNGTYTQGTPTSSIFYVRPYDATNTTAVAGSRFAALNTAQCRGTNYTLNATDLAANPTAPTTVCGVDYTAAYGVIQPEIKRYGGSAKVTAKLNDTIEAYAEFNFLQTTTDYTGQPAVIRGNAPAGIYYPQFSNSAAAGGAYTLNSGIIALPVYVCARAAGVSAVNVNGVPTVPGCTAANGTLNPNNPYAAQGYVARIQGRDLSSVTYNETRNRTYRGAFGVSGQVTDAITFDVGGTAMHDDLRRLQRGYVNIQHLLDVVADGTYNFVNPAANSQAVNDYLKPDNITNATSDQVQLQANMGFKLADLPGGPLQVAIGGSERYEAVNAPSGNSDFNGPTQRYFTLNAFGTVGSRWISSAYGEISAPVVKSLELTAAGRYDHYSSGQSAFSPKAGFKFKPVRQVMIRGTWSKGFRIPSFGEANSLPTTGYVTNPSNVFNDAYLAQYTNPALGTPCNVANFAKACPAYLTAGSYGYTTLATPTLKSEKSRSFTLGAVFEPVRNLSFTVDFYDIKKDQLITAPLAAPALIAYYSGGAIPAGYTVTADGPDTSDAFVSPTAKPRAALVLANLINANSQTVRGMDFEAEFRHKFSHNVTWTSSLEADWIMLLETKFADGHTERYDGTLGNYNLTAGSGTPSVKGTWMNTLEIGKVKITDTLNYISGYNLSAMDQGGTYKDCSLRPSYWSACNVKSLITTDVNVQVKVNDQFTVYGTVNNLLNQMPPIDPVTYGAHGYNPVQGGTAILGRYFKVGAKVNF